jgi:hypothetical protein
LYPVGFQLRKAGFGGTFVDQHGVLELNPLHRGASRQRHAVAARIRNAPDAHTHAYNAEMRTRICIQKQEANACSQTRKMGVRKVSASQPASQSVCLSVGHLARDKRARMDGLALREEVWVLLANRLLRRQKLQRRAVGRRPEPALGNLCRACTAIPSQEQTIVPPTQAQCSWVVSRNCIGRIVGSKDRIVVSYVPCKAVQRGPDAAAGCTPTPQWFPRIECTLPA